jgi:hypothetical protein
MSLFFDYRVDAPHKEDTLLVSWSKGKSILAVASSDNRILFYQEEVGVVAAKGTTADFLLPGRANTRL